MLSNEVIFVAQVINFILNVYYFILLSTLFTLPDSCTSKPLPFCIYIFMIEEIEF